MISRRTGFAALVALASVSFADGSRDPEVLRLDVDPEAATLIPATQVTGTARLHWQFRRETPSRLAGALVSFEPGARSAWHSHPHGQTLIVTSGTGYVQHWGGPRREVREGDVIWTPPGVKHWHGASPSSPMTHLALVETLDGKAMDSMEPVTDAQYAGH